MDKLTERIELRLSAETFAALQEIERKHQLSPQVVARALADAAADYFRKNGRFGFPISLSEESRTPTSPVVIDPGAKSARGEKGAGLPHEKTKHQPKKIPDKTGYRKLVSSTRGKQMVATDKLLARVKSQAPTASTHTP